MKKVTSKFILVLIFILGLSYFLNSCQKTPIKQKGKITASQSSYNKDLNIKIKSFRNKLLNNQKLSETITFKKGIWMLEAIFNYYHSAIDGTYDYITTDSIYLNVDYNNIDNIPLKELKNIYITTNNLLVEKFENKKINNKSVILFDFKLNKTSKGNKLICIMTIGGNYAGSIKSGKNLLESEPFDSDDYWTPGYITDNVSDATGKCGNYEGQYVGVSDATFELEKAARMYIRGYIHPGEYFVSIDSYNIYDYDGLFEGESSNCIPPNDMNLYFQVISNKINYWANYYNISSEKQFIDIDIKNDFIVNSNKDESIYYLQTYIHMIKYGKKVKRELADAVYALQIL